MNRNRLQSGLLLIAALAGMSPVSISTSAGLVITEACADGTCCPETGSDCFINGILTENAYKLDRPGPCKQVT